MAAKQKNHKLKRRLTSFKRLVKNKKTKFKPNEEFKKIKASMNVYSTFKYDELPNEAEKKSLESKECKLKYEFSRLK